LIFCRPEQGLRFEVKSARGKGAPASGHGALITIILKRAVPEAGAPFAQDSGRSASLARALDTSASDDIMAA